MSSPITSIRLLLGQRPFVSCSEADHPILSDGLTPRKQLHHAQNYVLYASVALEELSLAIPLCLQGKHQGET